MSHKSLNQDILNFFSGWSSIKVNNSYWNKIYSLLLISFLFILPYKVNSQSFDNYNVNSPYSRIGIGNLAPEGSIRNFGMGGTGVSQSNGYFLNSINPALLINNKVFRYDSMTTVLDGAMITQIRKISDNNASQNRGTANFFSFYYAFPINKRWVTAVGLKPYSNVSYSINVNAPVVGTNETAEVTYQGKGGINRAELANAFKVSRTIQLGFSGSYLFGAVNNYSFSKLNSQPDSNIVGSNQSLYYKGFLFRPGASFRKQLTYTGDTSLFLNVGLAYDWFVNTSAKENFYVERRNYLNQLISRINTDAIRHNVTFAPVIRSGISIDNGNRWNIALDFTYYQGSKFKGANVRDSLKNGYTIALGGEFGLKKKSELSINRYLRAGFSYSKSPLVVNNKQLNETSVSLGYSMSVARKQKQFRYNGLPFPQLNFAIVVGQIGTTKNNLIKEQYIKGFVGFTINDKWFKKRRID